MILEKNNLQTLRAKSELLKSYVELIALYVHPKNSIAIMAVDHSILGPGKQILGKQFRANFFAFESLRYKLLPTSLLGTCKKTFYTFYIHHI